MDPRGCPLPPLSTDIIWGSYDDSVTKSLDVGTSYWYSCRTGLFEIGADNFSAFIDLNCVNGPNGTPPLWIPAYDNFINPFPPCFNPRKYFLKLQFKHFEHHGNIFGGPEIIQGSPGYTTGIYVPIISCWSVLYLPFCCTVGI